MPPKAAESPDTEPVSGLQFARSVVLVPVEANPATHQPGESSPTPPTRGSEVEGRSKRRAPTYLLVGVAVVVVMVVLAYALSNGFHSGGGSSGTEGTVLVPRGTSYSMVIGQFNGIVFHVNSSAQIQGQVNSSRGIQVYIMTLSEFQYLVRNLTVGQYVWTSGVVADQTIYDLEIPVQPGQWVLSFVNPNVNFPTGVTFYTDLTLTSG